MRLEKNRNIFNAVIKQDLCIGCGACLYTSSKNDLKVQWNHEGFLVPSSDNSQVISEESLKVCPFNPFPEKEVRTENEIADIFFKNTPNKHPRIGNYFNTYVGFSSKYRLTSSSGGIATYFLSELLKKKIVDAVITVNEGEMFFYEYSVIRSSDELINSSKTRYFPVTLATVIEQLKNSNERFAIVGVACFIKSVRLLQYYHPELNDKIKFLIGIICGGVKSRFYTEYLASKSGVKGNQFFNPQFRIKDFQSEALDYLFGCNDSIGKFRSIRMRKVGDVWGTGLFKNNACDFCDDVTTELADISLGDAWIDPYKKDGKGTNVIVTRSYLADRILHDGMKKNDLQIDFLSISSFLKTQLGSFNHRQNALGYRIRRIEKQGIIIPPKRFTNETISFDQKCIQMQRLKVRRISFQNWYKSKNSFKFDNLMKQNLSILRIATKLNHLKRKFKYFFFCK